MTAMAARRQRLSGLRRQIEKLEGKRPLSLGAVGDVSSHAAPPNAVPSNSVTCGPAQLSLGALHEVRADDYRDEPAAQSLALVMAGKIARKTSKPVVLIGSARELFFRGRACRRGLAALGIDPGNIIFVYPHTVKEVLWAAEEAVNVSGVAAVLIEFFKPHKVLDLTATRRLQLAAASSGATPILLRSFKDKEPSAARTRLNVTAAPSAFDPYDKRASGNPRWGVELERCRAGGRGSWVLEWDDETQKLSEAPPLYGGAVAQVARRSPQALTAVA